MPAIPVYIISGFLGSGKTTSILNLLEQKIPQECWAIVVNEYGKISVDGDTLREKSLLGSVFDISGGCICCTSKLYLKDTLSKITASGEFDRIIIEPTGLGGIEMLTEIVKQLPDFNLMPVICMVDLAMFGNNRLIKNRIYRDQILRSELIFFSKCDLFSEPNLVTDSIEKFKTEFPGKEFCFTNDKLSVSFLDSFSEKSIDGKGFKMAMPEIAELKKEDYFSNFYSFGPEKIFNTGKIEKLLKENDLIFRSKGFINTPEGWFLFNHTPSEFMLKPCLPKEQNEFVIISENSNFKELNLEDIFA